MFEQSLYQQERVITPLHEGDLFYKYEITNWDLSPRLYKILGIAAVGNLLAILIVAQTSLLTMKGCDSPLVGSVCQVLDTVYLGSKMMGTDREYIDAAYDKTDLADSDITFVDVTGVTPPLSYPEGYFQLANPVEYALLQQQMMDPAMIDPAFSGLPAGVPITTPSTGGSLLDTPQVVPTPNPSVVQGPMPSFGSSGTSSGIRAGKPRKGNINTSIPDIDVTAENDPKPDKSPEPEPTPLSSDAVNAVAINKKPLTDFADSVALKWSTKQVDLNQNFTLVLNGFITPEGMLDRKKSKFDVAKTSGDPKMVDIGKAALEALGDSGFLAYLKLAGIDQVTATLTQDDKQVNVTITSLQKTPERANSVSSIVSGAIMLGKVRAANPSDERVLLDGAKTAADGKSFILNFTLPKEKAQEMINRKLSEAQAKQKQQPQPSSTTTEGKPDNSTARNK